MQTQDLIINHSDPILITGSNGFIGARLVHVLIRQGFVNLRCFVRPSSNLTTLRAVVTDHSDARVRIDEGNLLSRDDCRRITDDAAIIYHLAAGRGEKSFPDAFANSVVTTRNLIEAALHCGRLRRFVNVSSFSVYSNRRIKRGDILDEACDLETHPLLRGDAYCYAKLKQDELVMEYQQKRRLSAVIVRPGVVYGPGKTGIHGRVGIDTFGFFLHLGGPNHVPLTYVDNCAEAIALAGIVRGVDGEVFNIVDDNLPSARHFLKLYKDNVRRFRSLYVPYRAFYLFCYLWEKYSQWSQGQLPPAFNRRACETFWKGNRYSNAKAKRMLGWGQSVPTPEALNRYIEFQRHAEAQS